MNKEKYMDMLYAIDEWFQRDPILIQWDNGLKIKCRSFTGIMETDTEPGDEDYMGIIKSIYQSIRSIFDKGIECKILNYITFLKYCFI